MKDLRRRQMEQAINLIQQPRLTADELDTLGWCVSEEPDFIADMESIVYGAASPKVTFSKDDMRRILDPARNDARTLLYRIASPDSVFPNLNAHAELVDHLLNFIQSMDSQLEDLGTRPPVVRPKKEHPRKVVRRVLECFQNHGIEANTYQRGAFCTAVRVVFAAANRLNPGCMPKTTRTLVLEALSAKK